MDVGVSSGDVEVEENLGGLPDAGHSGGRCLLAKQGEPRDRVELEEERARDLEEVPDHEVGVPVVHQIGEGVEDVEGEATGLGHQVVHAGGEQFESHRRVEVVDLNGRVVRTLRGATRTVIPRGDMAAGPYTVRVARAGKQVGTARVVVSAP